MFQSKSEFEWRVSALQKLNDAFDELQILKSVYGDQRTAKTRSLQIVITDMEKVLAYYYVHLIAGQEVNDV